MTTGVSPVPSQGGGLAQGGERVGGAPGGGIGHWFAVFVGGMNATGTIGIVFLMVLINADILGRNLFGAPILGVPEVVRLVIVGVVFLQAAHTLSLGRLTRSTLGIDMLAKFRPAAARVTEGLFHLLGAALYAVIAWGAWPQLLKSWRSGEFLGAEGVFTVPVWPVKALVVFGCAMLAIQFCVAAWGILRGEVRS